jgi:hypothetical protein
VRRQQAPSRREPLFATCSLFPSATRTMTVALPECRFGCDLARIWHEGRSGTPPAYRVEPPAGALTWCGAGDGNRTRIVSLGTPPGTGRKRPTQVARVRPVVLDGLALTSRVARMWPIRRPDERLPSGWDSRSYLLTPLAASDTASNPGCDLPPRAGM